jgi:hypothetical protein
MKRVLVSLPIGLADKADRMASAGRDRGGGDRLGTQPREAHVDAAGSQKVRLMGTPVRDEWRGGRGKAFSGRHPDKSAMPAGPNWPCRIRRWSARTFPQWPVVVRRWTGLDE